MKITPAGRLPVLKGDTAVCIGVFDGVHLGHRQIIAATRRLAKSLGLRSMVVTLHPHPKEVLLAGYRHPYILSLKERLRRIGELGVDECRVLGFNHRAARLSPDDFIVRILSRECRARAVCVGANFHFGAKAAGNAKKLRAHVGKEFLRARIISPVKRVGHIVSSTQIRQLLMAGKVSLANRMLGEPYCLEGKVARGRGKGRSMGFPTANVNPAVPCLLPSGVYAAMAHWGNHHGPAALHIGPRPTFGLQTSVIEAHLLGGRGNFYGERIRLEIVQKLRLIQKFNSPQALIRQISLDVRRVKKIVRL